MTLQDTVLVCTLPNTCVSERLYVLDWVLREVLGFDVRVEWSDTPEVLLSVNTGAGQIRMPDTFFESANVSWLTQESLNGILTTDFVPSGLKHVVSLPVLFGDRSKSSYNPTTRTMSLPIDILGSIFFLISRYEEHIQTGRDSHGRFPYSESVLAKRGLIDRPIANEYIELLWNCMALLWPGLVRKQRAFRVLPSHDIDAPSCRWRTFSAAFQQSKEGLRDLSAKRIVAPWINYALYKNQELRNDWESDPNDTISWIMTTSEVHNLKSAFYYIPEKTSSYDPGMPLDHPHVIDQWKRIANRGHEIGVHPGYGSVDTPHSVKRAASLVRAQLERLNIHQRILGGRQHFLRWTNETAKAWDEAGLDYDSTLGFADHAGFRCGVCYEFPLYDLQRRTPLKVRERPLVVMDCTVVDSRYMGYGCSEEAFEYIRTLKSQCQKYEGDFTILWHNQRFRHREEREFYCAVLAS